MSDAHCPECGFVIRADEPRYLLNNNARAPLARWLMAEHADLDGFFETRERRSEDTPPRGDAA